MEELNLNKELITAVHNLISPLENIVTDRDEEYKSDDDKKPLLNPPNIDDMKQPFGHFGTDHRNRQGPAVQPPKHSVSDSVENAIA